MVGSGCSRHGAGLECHDLPCALSKHVPPSLPQPWLPVAFSVRPGSAPCPGCHPTPRPVLCTLGQAPRPLHLCTGACSGSLPVTLSPGQLQGGLPPQPDMWAERSQPSPCFTVDDRQSLPARIWSMAVCRPEDSSSATFRYRTSCSAKLGVAGRSKEAGWSWPPGYHPLHPAPALVAPTPILGSAG